MEVVVSTGPGEVTIPADIIGMSQDEARQALKDLGLEPRNADSTTAPLIEAGHVVETDPAVGSKVPKGQKVDLLISNGNTIVPDVRGQSEEAAKAALTAAGLLPAESQRLLSNKPAGTVLKQSVKPNREVAQGTQVTLTVARAPATISMPSVTGKSVEEAEGRLRERGLENIVKKYEYSEAPNGTVIGQQPAPGEDIVEGSKVVLIISNGPSPTPTVNPTPPTTPPPVDPSPTPSL